MQTRPPKTTELVPMPEVRMTKSGRRTHVPNSLRELCSVGQGAPGRGPSWTVQNAQQRRNKAPPTPTPKSPTQQQEMAPPTPVPKSPSQPTKETTPDSRPKRKRKPTLFHKNDVHSIFDMRKDKWKKGSCKDKPTKKRHLPKILNNDTVPKVTTQPPLQAFLHEVPCLLYCRPLPSLFQHPTILP